MTVTIEIFRAGTHTSANGVTLEYTDEMLRECAAGYEPNFSEAPVVIGHPATDAAAYGWAKQLSVKDGVLSAELDQLDPEFTEAVKAGRYKKVSASFYLPSSPSNPKPGALYLRHIGFLGAAAPAVKGLKQVSFSEDVEGIADFELPTVLHRNLARRLREWLLRSFGKEAADEVVPGYEIEMLDDELAQERARMEVPQVMETAHHAEAEGEPGVAATEGTGPDMAGEAGAIAETEQVVETQAAENAADHAEASADPAQSSGQNAVSGQEAGAIDFAEAEARIAAREAELSAREARLREAECASFCESLVAAGQLRPVDAPRAESLMRSLYQSAAVVEFSDAEGATPAADAFKQFLQGLPKLVEFAEVAVEEAAPRQAVAEFAAPPGYEVGDDRDYREIAALAAEKGIDFLSAARMHRKHQ